MGLFDRIFGGKSRQRRAQQNQISGLQSGLRGLGTQAGTAFGTLAGEVEGFYKPALDYQQQQMDSVLNRFMADRTANIDQYRTGYEQNISQFQTAYDDIRRQYTAGMERVYGEAATGRQAMLESVDLATQRNVARMQARNAFSGLGLTTFGQQAVSAQESEGARQRGVIQEQYAGQLAAIRQAQTAGETALAQQQAGGLSDLRTQRTTGLAEMGASYSSALAGLQQGLGSQRLGLMMGMQGQRMDYRQQQLMAPIGYQEQALTMPFNAQMNLAMQRGSGSQQFTNALMGAGLGLAGNVLGSIFG
jgi:hypothetical protein